MVGPSPDQRLGLMLDGLLAEFTTNVFPCGHEQCAMAALALGGIEVGPNVVQEFGAEAVDAYLRPKGIPWRVNKRLMPSWREKRKAKKQFRKLQKAGVIT